MRTNLHSGLASLLQLKNDYQIIVQTIPEDNEEMEENMEEYVYDRIVEIKLRMKLNYNVYRREGQKYCREGSLDLLLLQFTAATKEFFA